MAQLTDWIKILNNIIFFHEEDSIVFKISDVEELLTQMRAMESKNEKLMAANEQLAKNLDRAQNQLLITAIKTLDRTKEACEPVSKFKVYA